MRSKLEIQQRLEREFEICDKHLLRINESMKELKLPFTAEEYANLESEKVRCVDQYVFRFSKLQDAIGAKIFPLLLEYLDEDISNSPMRDILDKLERFKIIDSAEEWMFVRELRNDIAHDYPLAQNDVVDTINSLFSKADYLETIFIKIKAIYELYKEKK